MISNDASAHLFPKSFVYVLVCMIIHIILMKVTVNYEDYFVNFLNFIFNFYEFIIIQLIQFQNRKSLYNAGVPFLNIFFI